MTIVIDKTNTLDTGWYLTTFLDKDNKNIFVKDIKVGNFKSIPKDLIKDLLVKPPFGLLCILK